MRHETVMMICGERKTIRPDNIQLTAAAVGIFISITVITAKLQIMFFDPGWALLFAVVFLLSYPRSHRSMYTRMMWIRSSRANEIEDAIMEAVGRGVIRIPMDSRGDQGIPRMKLVIYRLEERTLKDLVYSIDSAAECVVVPVYEWKRGDRQDLR
ncbi:hypothetical protein ACFOLF_09750 [Paenibacillus sepulcri]|uniref:DUF2179 domain-containing protein n=1 Tax=Paenibacillus sepulcri TaxID=359917 RepID=A0ABS7C0C2_9BACL|nr:hypothetical protein [Paenibacillus sepulcri]